MIIINTLQSNDKPRVCVYTKYYLVNRVFEIEY